MTEGVQLDSRVDTMCNVQSPDSCSSPAFDDNSNKPRFYGAQIIGFERMVRSIIGKDERSKCSELDGKFSSKLLKCRSDASPDPRGHGR